MSEPITNSTATSTFHPDSQASSNETPSSQDSQRTPNNSQISSQTTSSTQPMASGAPTSSQVAPSDSIKRLQTPPMSTDVQSWREPMNASVESTPATRADLASPARDSTVHGSKRTASGVIKISTSPDRLALNGNGPPSASLTSPNGQVSKLSEQLKTRLSYAMVKVRYGWQDRTFEEVEDLASQLHSPVSDRGKERIVLSSTATSAVNGRTNDLTHATNRHDARYAPYDPQKRRQGHHHQSHSISYAPSLTASASLAPAVDLDATPRGRRNTGPIQPPRLLTNSRPPTSASASSSKPLSSLTGTTTPTPQEQDAVDTLLFMSSPANSGHYPSNRANTANGHFSHFPRPGNGFTANGIRRESTGGSSQSSGSRFDFANNRTTASSHHKRGGSLSNFKPVKNGEDVERLLDEVREYSSSADVEHERSKRQHIATSQNVAPPPFNGQGMLVPVQSQQGPAQR